MMTDITGRPRFDPKVILQDMEKAIAFFSDVIKHDLPTDVLLDDLVIHEGGTGVSASIEEDLIVVGQTIHIPGVHTMPNGDPGYPDEFDFAEAGSFTLDKKNDAIDCMIGLIAVELFKQAGECAAEEAYAEQLEQVDDLPLIGTEEVPGSHFNYLRRGMKSLQEQGKEHGK